MEFWQRTCLLLCCFGFFKDFRPSEPFVNDYLLGPVHNLTEAQVYYEIYPVWTYSYFAVLIVVFLVTDFLRYKVVIVFESLAYISTWCLLLWARGVPWMQFMECCYGIVSATEVAYYTYIYAQVSEDRYQTVASYTRTALLCGRFASGTIGQILYSTGVMDSHTLNYVTLASECIALCFAISLPTVKYSLYFHRFENNPTDSGTPSIADSFITPSLADSSISANSCCVKLTDEELDSAFNFKKVVVQLFEDFKGAYSSQLLLRWSIWWSVATCGCLMVLNYIQPLYDSVRDGENESVYNGAVEAICTLLGAGAAFSVSYLKLDWTRHGETVLALISLLEASVLVVMGLSGSIVVTYICYIVFRVSYEFIITIARYQVAKELKSDSYALIFGVNMFMALALQTLMTVIVVDVLMIEPELQFVIYGVYFGFLSLFFFVLTAYRFGGEACGRTELRTSRNEEKLYLPKGIKGFNSNEEKQQE